MKHLFCLFSATALLLTGCSLFENWGKRAASLSIHEQVPANLPSGRVRIVELPDLDLKVPVDPFPSLTQFQIGSAEV